MSSPPRHVLVPSLPPLAMLFDAVERGPDAVIAAAQSWLTERGVPDARLIVESPASADGASACSWGGGSESTARSAAIARGGRRWGQLESGSMSAESLAGWAEAMGACLDAAERIQRLRELAYTDVLTSAGNRRAFEQYIETAMATAVARQRPLTLMLFDIDDFKTYNDRFGHAAGDEVLRETVSLLRSVIRRGDAVFRLGGDEFVVVFGDPASPRAPTSPPIESVDQIAARFTERIQSMQLPALGALGLGPIGVSAGIATFPEDGRDPRSLLDAADRRAMESKRRGKARITFGPAKE